MKFLAVDRLKNSTRHRLLVGNYASLRKQNNQRAYGRLNEILDSAIIVAADTIQLSDIKTVYIKKKGNGVQLVGNLLIYSAAGYFALSTTNRAMNRDSPVVHPSTYQYGAVALGLGLIIKTSFSPRVKIKDPSQLKILKLYIE